MQRTEYGDHVQHQQHRINQERKWKMFVFGYLGCSENIHTYVYYCHRCYIVYFVDACGKGRS